MTQLREFLPEGAVGRIGGPCGDTRGVAARYRVVLLTCYDLDLPDVIEARKWYVQERGGPPNSWESRRWFTQGRALGQLISNTDAFRRAMAKKPLAVPALPGLLPGTYCFAIRPGRLRWGATPEELARPLPGYQLAADSSLCATRAVTIAGRTGDIRPIQPLAVEAGLLWRAHPKGAA